jgi:hypothetical protein
VPDSPLAAVVNDLHGGRENWRLGQRAYERLRMPQVYPGIDAVFYGFERQLEYDLIVAPGASVSSIDLRFSGVDAVRLDDEGNLELQRGTLTMTQRRPVAYQERDGARVPVGVRYVLEGRRARFDVDDYDATRTLVIDPIVSYSSYVGSSGYDTAASVVTDSARNLYVVGAAGRSDLPATSYRPHASGIDGARPDVLVARFRPDGSIDWLTLLGGSDWDSASDIAIGATGDLFITGSTSSIDFPATRGSYDPVGHNGGSQGGEPGDAFIVRLSPDGTTVRWATYFGGGQFWGGDSAAAIALDAQEKPHIVGATRTRDFPVTMASSRGKRLPDYYNSEAFVARFSADGARLELSRLLAGFEYEAAADVALDANGGIYVVGTTSSTDFPVKNAVQPTKFGPNGVEGEDGRDGFLTHVWTSGSIVYSTYLGGPGEEDFYTIARGKYSRIYIGGRTTSQVLAGANVSKPGGPWDADGVIFQVVPNATSIVYTRYLGGPGEEAVTGLAVDPSLDLWVSGSTTSAWRTTSTAFQTTAGGDGDIFLEHWSANLGTLAYATLLGGGNRDTATGVAVDTRGDVYVSGQTRSADYPAVNAIQTAYKPTAGQFGWQGDGVITKLTCTISVKTPGPFSAAAGGGTLTVNLSAEPGCVTDTKSNTGWIRITQLTKHSVSVAVDANASGAPRSGSIVVAGRTIVVNQG